MSETTPTETLPLSKVDLAKYCTQQLVAIAKSNNIPLSREELLKYVTQIADTYAAKGEEEAKGQLNSYCTALQTLAEAQKAEQEFQAAIMTELGPQKERYDLGCLAEDMKNLDFQRVVAFQTILSTLPIPGAGAISHAISTLTQLQMQFMALTGSQDPKDQGIIKTIGEMLGGQVENLHNIMALHQPVTKTTAMGQEALKAVADNPTIQQTRQMMMDAIGQGTGAVQSAVNNIIPMARKTVSSRQP